MPASSLGIILRQIFSEARINAYRLCPQEPHEETLKRYQWDLRLSEAMMPCLAYVEVVLRNRLDRLIGSLHDPDWLLEPPQELQLRLQLSPNQKQKLQDARKRLAKLNKELTNDDMVSAMSLSFWIPFFAKRHGPLLWHKKRAIASVFPHLKASGHQISTIPKALHRIKSMRNRVAHHEPVYDSNIVKVHTDCLQLLEAMSTDALAYLQTIDRLLDVWGEKA